MVKKIYNIFELLNSMFGNFKWLEQVADFAWKL